MNISSFHALQSKIGAEVLEAATRLEPREEEFLRHFQGLARLFPPEMAQAALETAILRKEAKTKFPFAEKMFFTRQALQQASGWEISTYRAARYAGFTHIFDLGCSIGSDSLAMCGTAPVTGVDLDELRLDMANANAENLGLINRVNFIRGDLTAGLPFVKSRGRQDWALFFDPARREGDKRIFSVDDYHPPLNIVNSWIEEIPSLGVKISPGVDLREIQSYDAEVEFISVKGELKEAVLWFGALKSAVRRATLLPGVHTLVEEYPDALSLSDPKAYIYEPDPAVLRAGLVSTLGQRLNACQLDPAIAYLTGKHMVETPFARAWKIETWLPFGIKRLRSYLRQQNVGKVTVKKRGSPLEPDALIHELRLKGEQERMIFLTHLKDKPITIVAFPEHR